MSRLFFALLLLGLGVRAWMGWRSFGLVDCENLVRPHILDSLHNSTRPVNLDRLCCGIVAEAEMSAAVAGGKVAASRSHGRVLHRARGRDNLDFSPDAVAVARVAHQT